MKLESNSVEVPANNSISEDTKKTVAPKVIVTEPRMYIQEWAVNRLDRSIGQLESLGAYMDQETKSGHEYDTSSRFEQGYLEFYQRPVLA